MKIEVSKQEDGKWTALVDGEIKGQNLECVLGVIDNMPVPLLHAEENDEFLLDDLPEGEEGSRPDLWISVAGIVMAMEGPLSDTMDLTRAEFVLEGEVKGVEDEPNIIQFPGSGLILPN